MKNSLIFGFFALTVATTFMSCKKTNKTTYDYSPPSWLIGNWNDSIWTQINNYNTLGYKVTSNDVIQVSVTEQSFKALSQGNNEPVQEELNGNTYHITLKNSLGQAGHYYFTKISSTKVKLTNVDPSLNPMNYSILLKY